MSIFPRTGHLLIGFTMAMPDTRKSIYAIADIYICILPFARNEKIGKFFNNVFCQTSEIQH